MWSFVVPLSLLSVAVSSQQTCDKLPKNCSCTGFEVDCSNVKFKNDDVITFIAIEPTAGSVDKITITGNDFHDLSHVNMFGAYVGHLKKLETLLLPKNDITFMSRVTFGDLNLLRTLDLSDNPFVEKFNNVTDVTMFKDLPELINLTIDNVFSEQPEKQYSELLTWGKIFKQSNMALTYLSMRKNKLSFLQKDFLCPLGRLQTLQLDHNSLTEFAPSQACFSISYLYLRYNHIRYLGKQFTHEINKFSQTINFKLLEIYLEGNPFHCDANLRLFLNWLQPDDHRIVADRYKLVCATALPTRFAGVHLMDVEVTQLQFPPDGSKYSHDVYVVLCIALVVLIIVMLVVLYSRRRSLIRLFQKCANKSTAPDPYSYAVLTRDPEVQPEMV